MPKKSQTAAEFTDEPYMPAIRRKLLTKTDLKREKMRLELDDMF